jgi:thymidylate synthase
MHSQVIQAKSVDDAFLSCASIILNTGREISPRNQDTIEIPPCIVEILDPTDCIISFKERKHPYSFMVMELIWILSGDENPWIIDWLPKLREYTDIIDGKEILAGAYGPRIRKKFGTDQLSYVIFKLLSDSASRQALITISNPQIDVNGYHDLPCTESLQFMIRDNKLDLTVVMRANDLVLGSCVDWFNFCTIQCIMASILKLPLGIYRHFANSLHIYKRDLEKVERILSNPEKISVPFRRPIDVDYFSLEEVYNDATWGRKLLEISEVPNSKRYLFELMKYAHSKSRKVDAIH